MLLFAATIDRFESLKGLGVEAKTRQLDQKIEQADEMLRRLKELAELTGVALVELSSNMGRLGPAPSAQKLYDFAQKVRNIMTALGSDSHYVSEALRPWVRITCIDLVRAIASPVHNAVEEKLRDLDQQLSAIPEPIDTNDPDFARITASKREGDLYPERLRNIHQLKVHDYPDRAVQLFENVPLVDQEVQAAAQDKARKFIPDMTSLCQTLQLPDPEPWFSEIEEHCKKGG